MTWDNVIGYDPLTPYDTAKRLKNMPAGDQATVDTVPGQMGKLRPIPELARYRTPIKNFYLCGGSNHPQGGINGAPGYNSAGVMAQDFGLKPWWMQRARR